MKRARLTFALVSTVATLSIATTALAQGDSSPTYQPYNPPPSTYQVPGAMSPYDMVKNWTTPPWTANRGLQVGARVGYGAGSGVVYSGFTVNDGSHGSVPIILDFGIRFIPQLYLGLYGQYAPVIVKTNPVSCPSGFDCSVQDWRFGLELDYHFVPRSRVDPYIGVGGGYEILHSSVSGSAPVPAPGGSVVGQVNATATDRGWEFIALSFGLDVRASSWFGIGPFATATIGEYGVRTGSQTVAVGGAAQTVALANVEHASHELFIVGLRGTFNP